jgi:hypothetical protein
VQGLGASQEFIGGGHEPSVSLSPAAARPSPCG